MAITMPTTVRGAPAASTACSMLGDNALARPTTVTSANTSNAKLIQASRVVGGSACACGSAAFSTGMK